MDCEAGLQRRDHCPICWADEKISPGSPLDGYKTGYSKVVKRFCAAFAMMFLSGCAATGSHPTAGASHWTKLISVQSAMAAEDASLSYALSVTLPVDSLERERFVKEAKRKVEARASVDLQDALAIQANTSIDESAESVRATRDMGIDHWDSSLTKEMTDQLRTATGANGLIRFRITDYGHTPRSWRNGVIAFEVVSTLGIAAVAYSYPKTRALAGAYLLQETIEESAEAFAGFWALDEVCRPVRMQAQLFDLHTGAMVWEGSATGLSDIRISRLFRKIATDERETQLRNATVASAKKLARGLADAIGKGVPIEAPNTNPLQ